MITVNSNGLCERLKKGIRVLEEYGFLQEKEDGISLYAVYGNEVLVERAEDFISITYDSEPHFYMALARSIGMSAGIHTIESKAKRLGFMLDCSRNAVPKPAMVGITESAPPPSRNRPQPRSTQHTSVAIRTNLNCPHFHVLAMMIATAS